MKTQIVKIGNSQGIRIPKIMIEESQLGKEVELIADHEQIIIRSIKKLRSGWEEFFEAMSKQGDDQLIDRDVLASQSSWDENKWIW